MGKWLGSLPFSLNYVNYVIDYYFPKNSNPFDK